MQIMSRWVMQCATWTPSNLCHFNWPRNKSNTIAPGWKLARATPDEFTSLPGYHAYILRAIQLTWSSIGKEFWKRNYCTSYPRLSIYLQSCNISPKLQREAWACETWSGIITWKTVIKLEALQRGDIGKSEAGQEKQVLKQQQFHCCLCSAKTEPRADLCTTMPLLFFDVQGESMNRHAWWCVCTLWVCVYGCLCLKERSSLACLLSTHQSVRDDLTWWGVPQEEKEGSINNQCAKEPQASDTSIYIYTLDKVWVSVFIVRVQQRTCRYKCPTVTKCGVLSPCF